MSQGEGRSQRTVVTKRNIQVSSTASVAIIGSPIIFADQDGKLDG
jgi:hypothetical protein